MTRSLLYVGADADIGPLLFPAFRRGFARIIYVDDCQESSDGTRFHAHFRTKRELLASITRRLGGGASSPHWKVVDGGPGGQKLHWFVPLGTSPPSATVGGELHYFFVKEEAAHATAVLRDWLPSVTRVLVKGFTPQHIWAHLPALEEVFSTPFAGVGLPAHVQRLLMPILQESRNGRAHPHGTPPGTLYLHHYNIRLAFDDDADTDAGIDLAKGAFPAHFPRLVAVNSTEAEYIPRPS